jgi:hypothetical protein
VKAKQRQRDIENGQDYNEMRDFNEKKTLDYETGWSIDETDFYHYQGVRHLITDKHENVYPVTHALLNENDNLDITYVIDNCVASHESVNSESHEHILDEEDIVDFEVPIFNGLFPGEDI